MSNSSREKLHNCPRFYQIYKLLRSGKSEGTSEGSGGDNTIDTVFGKVVGLGTQMLIVGATREETIFAMFLQWTLPELEQQEWKPKKKSFFWAVAAIDSFAVHIKGFFTEWKVAHFGDGRPATELGYTIDFGDGFIDRGKLDLVLEHKVTGELLVYEGKTSGKWNIDEAMYGNSDQGLGYGVVLDTISASLGRERPSSYRVLYFVYDTRNTKWIPFPLTKTRKQRAQWIQNVLLDKSRILEYSNHNYWPMYGENCITKYNSICQFYGVCNLDIANFVGKKPLHEVPIYRDREEEYQFHFTVLDLIDVQLEETHNG